MKKLILVAIAAVLLAAGCSAPAVVEASAAKPRESAAAAEGTAGGYTKITGEEAKKMMDSGSGSIILDVRTQEEYDEGHIKNAILLPDSQIEADAAAVLPDKDAEILVYCRTGRRSALAAQELVDMGYTNVKDFGGIVDWEYDIVKD